MQVLRLLQRCMRSPEHWDVAMFHRVIGARHFDKHRDGLSRFEMPSYSDAAPLPSWNLKIRTCKRPNSVTGFLKLVELSVS
jgi:hypothetical protein